MDEFAALPAAERETGGPARNIPGDTDRPPQVGTALCLSGGGYRAMLFHAGVVWRLNDARLLGTLDRISSVSGGSITAGVLAMKWAELRFLDGVADALTDAVVAPLRELASVSIDYPSVIASVLPFVSATDIVRDAYAARLFGKTTLADLPDSPDFVFNASNLGSGVLLRMSKPYLADYRVGRVLSPDLSLSSVVAASSAFPPFLSPSTLDLTDASWTTETGNDLTGPEFRGRLHVTDGGVYDNLGLETAWKRYTRIFISDGGRQLAPDSHPKNDWLLHTDRIMAMMESQTQALRKRQAITAFQQGDRVGMYVGITSDPTRYPVAPTIPSDRTITSRLAATPTRLKALEEPLQERLINWGYAACDTALRAHVATTDPMGQLPYPARPLTTWD